MSRVVIVARTRMHGGHVCIGGHDLDVGFRGVRLLDRFGGYWTSDAPFKVGAVWNLAYRQKASVEPPHVEDVYVNEQCRVGEVADLKGLVLKHARPWTGGPEALFDATVRGTPSGAAYIPTKGRLPRSSTGFWVPEDDLVRQIYGPRVRFFSEGDGAVKRLVWVGVAHPPERIAAGSLLRVSLSHAFGSETVPEGYYVQLSGVLE